MLKSNKKLWVQKRFERLILAFFSAPSTPHGIVVLGVVGGGWVGCTIYSSGPEQATFLYTEKLRVIYRSVI